MRSVTRWLVGLLAVSCGLGGALGGCGGREHPPTQGGFHPSGGSGTGSGGAGGGDLFDSGVPDGPPPCPDTQGLCACEEVAAIADAPNLYFVLDASGSMKAQATPNQNRYEAVRGAATNLVRTLGPLIKVGAAIFPHGIDAQHQCEPGSEVMAVAPGDPVTGTDGPTTTAFLAATDIDPLGGTPVSATLAAIAPTLKALPGKTFVLLSTDGGPNCNPLESCDASTCIPNIEQDPACDGINCCDPAVGYGGTLGCLDDTATLLEIQKLADAGIVVYVIGIPGSEHYESLLGSMAVAGGGDPPEGGSSAYYKVTDLTGLGGVLSHIASLAVTCDFDLGQAPPDQNLTNVYLDGALVAYDDPDGWFWKDPHTVELVGMSCDRLKNGQVAKVQIVAGCPSEGPK